MALVFARVDSRLIHGQVLEGWIPFTGATMVIVADDVVAASSLQRKVMTMAVPEEIKLRIESIDDAIADLEDERLAGERILLLFSSLQNAFEACRRGIRCGSINIGNVNYTAGRRQVTPYIALDDNDVHNLRGLIACGVKIDVRGVPRERPVNIDEVLAGYSAVCRREP